jgi:hypothetical protein
VRPRPRRRGRGHFMGDVLLGSTADRVAHHGRCAVNADALRAATIVCRSIAEALELLLVPGALTATLRR